MSGEERREEARRLVEEGAAGGEAAGGEAGGGDIEELRQLLTAVSEFLNNLTGPIERILNTLLSAMDGARLGEEVAEFYRRLRESGMPENLAAEMTREYFKTRMESVNVMGLLTKFLRREVLEEEGEGEG